MSYYDPPEPYNVYCEYCSDEIDTEPSFISENAGAGEVHYFCNEDCQASYAQENQ